MFVKDGITKFDNNVAALNDPSVKFGGHDGATNTLAQQRFFPKSQLLSIPGDAPATETLDMLRYGKVDATLASAFEGIGYMQANPNNIRRVVSPPIRFIPMNISVAANEFRLVNMLDTATNELLYEGTIERLFDQYNIDSSTVLRVDAPYSTK